MKYSVNFQRQQIDQDDVGTESSLDKILAGTKILTHNNYFVLRGLKFARLKFVFELIFFF